MLKPGYKTTEFFALVVTIANVIVQASAGASTKDVLASLGASIAAGLYAIGRGLAKRAPVVLPPTP